MTTDTTITKQTIPLLDLNAQYRGLEDEVFAAFKDVFDSKQFIMGPKIAELESQIADYCQTKHAIGVSSGTDALVLSLMALGIGAGDEVIISPFTFFATAGSVARVGATPVFVDIDPVTFNMDVNQLEAAITERTKAIMPVHLFGQMADMDPILSIAKSHDLFVIEDAAQAIGSEYNGKRAGSVGDVGCFSFFPSKNLGACGDAGIITTNSDEIAEQCRIMRVHGGHARYYHDVVGGNFRLDSIQAAILSVKLPHLEAQHDGRQKNAAFYNSHLTDQVGKPKIGAALEGQSRMIYNQYTIRVKDRESLQAHLTEYTVGNAIYYPVPLHLQECFKELGYKEGDLPHAELAAKEVLSLPIYPELSQDQLSYVAEVINSFYK